MSFIKDIPEWLKIALIGVAITTPSKWYPDIGENSVRISDKWVYAQTAVMFTTYGKTDWFKEHRCLMYHNILWPLIVHISGGSWVRSRAVVLGLSLTFDSIDHKHLIM